VKKPEKKLEQLEKELKIFLGYTDFVAWRSVVVKPERVARKWDKLAQMVGFKSARK